MNEIIVTGYPKSGNTWLSRLLGDILNSPVTGRDDYEAVPISQEGLDRSGDYTIIQLHLVPDCSNHNNQFITNRFHICPDNHTDEKIVIPIRDPRDVAVSCMHYGCMILPGRLCIQRHITFLFKGGMIVNCLKCGLSTKI